MPMDGHAFAHWLDETRIPQSKRAPHQLAVLKAAFDLLQQTGSDYASRRIVAHFLLNCQLDLKLVQVARLVDVTRPTVSRQKGLSSRDVVREIQQRLAGRPYGKLLPRYAGPVAHFLATHPDASRNDVLDFIHTTWSIRVSRVALHNFLKKYGLDRKSLEEAFAVERSRPLLPSHQPVGCAARSGRADELRRTYDSPLDEEVFHPQRLSNSHLTNARPAGQ